MRCKACNANMTERKNTRGDYLEICSACNRVSSREAAWVETDIEAILHKYSPQRDPADILAEALEGHVWGERLGLRLSQEAVEKHLAERATAVYWDSIALGMMPYDALEEALGNKKFRGRCLAGNVETEGALVSDIESGNLLNLEEF